MLQKLRIPVFCILNSSTFKATPSQIDKYLIQEQAVKAEILWAFETVMSHSSLNSNRNKPGLFQSMFPDIDVAKQYQMKASGWLQSMA